MVEAAEDGFGDEMTRLGSWTVPRTPDTGIKIRNALDSLVRPSFVVVADEPSCRPQQVALGEEDEMMEALPFERAYEAFNVVIMRT